MNMSLIVGLLLLLAGLFGMVPWVWPTFDSRISWALVFVVGVAILFQGKF